VALRQEQAKGQTIEVQQAYWICSANTCNKHNCDLVQQTKREKQLLLGQTKRKYFFCIRTVLPDTHLLCLTSKSIKMSSIFTHVFWNIYFGTFRLKQYLQKWTCQIWHAVLLSLLNLVRKPIQKPVHTPLQHVAVHQLQCRLWIQSYELPVQTSRKLDWLKRHGLSAGLYWAQRIGLWAYLEMVGWTQLCFSKYFLTTSSELSHSSISHRQYQDLGPWG